MRELDPHNPPAPPACAVVGAGRLGTVLAAALDAGRPLRRGEPVPSTAEAVLLCVPDGQIAAAAAAVPPDPLVGHCSGATGLAVLAPHEAFGLHPLMTVPAEGAPSFAGAGCAVAGSTPRAEAFARDLAQRLG